MLHLFVSIVGLVSMALAAFGLGRPILRCVRVELADRLSVAVWGIALGLLAVGLLLLGLGFLGVLYSPLICLLTAAACLLGLGEILAARLRAERDRATGAARASLLQPGQATDGLWVPPRWLLRGMCLAAGLACLGALVAALAPPTAAEAVDRHFDLPKACLAGHQIPCASISDNAALLRLGDLWHLWALALGGGSCAQLADWGLGVLLALAAAVLAAPIVGPRWAWIVGALVLLTPGVNQPAGAPPNDTALAALSTLALAAWWRATLHGEGRRWLVLAGLAASGAAATANAGLLLVVAVVATWLWQLLRQDQQGRILLRRAAILGALAAAVGGLSYFTTPWFSAGATGSLPASAATHAHGPAARAAQFDRSTQDCFGHVLLLAAVPGLLLTRRLRGVGALLAVALGYGVICLLLRESAHWLLPAVPLLAVAAVWVWIEMGRFPARARWVAVAGFAVLVAVTAMGAMSQSPEAWAVAVGLEDCEQYLARHDPTYTAAAVANQLLAGSAHLLSQDDRTFYFDCRVTRENVFRGHTHYDRCIADPAQFSHQLRCAGFTHLLLAETLNGPGPQEAPPLSRLAEAQWSTAGADALLTLTEYWHQDRRGLVRRYRLVMLR